jgi:ubiquinone/menaquinone biosynthesis C-methylase UbiE
LKRYVISGGRIGYDRLQVLARERWPDTAELLGRIGVGPPMRCLDVGCGGGAVTLELARLVAAGGHVVGIDMDDVKLGLAREAAAERGLTNVEFRVGDVDAWSADAEYDLVYCRFLLQHLDDPRDLLRRMWAAVRPGGTLAVEDADFAGRFSEPPNEGHEFARRIYDELLRRRGGDPRIGRKLHGTFLELGAPAPAIRLRQGVYSEGEPKTVSLLTLRATEDSVLAEDLATEDEIAAALSSLAAYTDDPRTLITTPWVFQVWAQKP